MRQGRWKLLCEYDGSQVELYDLQKDRGETTNVAKRNEEVVKKLLKALLDWHRSMPADNGATYGQKRLSGLVTSEGASESGPSVAMGESP